MFGIDEKEDVMFTLDKGVRFIPSKRCLIAAGGGVIGLSENNYRFLVLLLEGETDKQKIIKKVWHEQRGSVSESSYYGQLYLLRRAFNLVGLPHSLIKTIPRKGVKYIGYVASETVSDKAILDDIAEAEPFILEDDNANDNILDSVNSLKTKESADKHHLEGKTLRSTMGSWYQTRSWNIFVTTLAVLAVCWLTTIIFFMILILNKY